MPKFLFFNVWRSVQEACYPSSCPQMVLRSARRFIVEQVLQLRLPKPHKNCLLPIQISENIRTSAGM